MLEIKESRKNQNMPSIICKLYIYELARSFILCDSLDFHHFILP